MTAILGVSLFLAACSGGADPKQVVANGSIMSGSFVLALSWEPAFCETASHVPECQAQTADSIDARQFSLHGLWPENVYCGVDAATRKADEAHHWQSLPPVALSEDLRAALDIAMPGTQSLLERHEWIKHGTCSGVGQQAYFAATLKLVAAINHSALPELFVSSIGNSLSGVRVAGALDDEFGDGIGKRMTLECVSDGSRRLISGLRISLVGTIDADAGSDLGALAAAAASRSGGCRGGVVDPAGFQ